MENHRKMLRGEKIKKKKDDLDSDSDEDEEQEVKKRVQDDNNIRHDEF